MKTFENKVTDIDIVMPDNSTRKTTYTDLILMCVNSPLPPGRSGLTSSEIRKDLKLLDKIEDAEVNDTIQLEDDEYETLTSHVKRMNSYPFRHKDVVTFEDYILQL